jgi:vitamin B12 transporter
MRHIFKAAILALTSLTCLPAHAEDDIVVTATRTPTAAARLPADITLIDTDEARARGEFTLDQALAQAPGIQAPRTGPIGQQTSIFSGGFESNHTLILFDGVRLDDPSTPEGIFDSGQDMLGDARRVEVVQGPMSALYGAGALGGVVNILPRRGGAGLLNPRLEVAAGSFETLLANVGADGTLGRLRYALNAEAYASAGYDIVPERVATHTGEPDGAEMAMLTGVFDYALNNRLALDLLLRRREARADYDPGLFGNIDENPAAELSENDAALWRLGATWDPAEGFSLRFSGGALDTDRVTADVGVTGDEYHGERRFADVTATWQAPAWTVLLGASSETEDITAMSFGAPIAGARDHWGAFGAAHGGWGPIEITAAARHDDFDGFGGEQTWRAGASARLGGDARLYAAFGTSYRPPSLYELYVPFFGASGLRPEHAETWELGADAEFAFFGHDDGLHINALYRTSEIDDLIGFSGFSYANVDRANIAFAEARISVKPLPWLTARLVYANTDARDVATDRPLQRRPRHAWSAELNAEHGAYTVQISWREVGARTDTIYDDLGFFAGAGRAEAYDVVRASAAWAVSERARLYISADNLLDEIYEPVNGFAGAPASVLFGIRVTP